MLDCGIRYCFLSNQPLTVFTGHYVHLKLVYKMLLQYGGRSKLGLCSGEMVWGGKKGFVKASPKLGQPLMTFYWILARVMTLRWQNLLHIWPPQSAGYFTHHTQVKAGCMFLYPFLMYLLSSLDTLKKKNAAYLQNVPTCIFHLEGRWGSNC